MTDAIALQPAARGPIAALISAYRAAARRHRGKIFRDSIPLHPHSLVLDLGGGDGSHIAAVVGPRVSPRNIHVADIRDKKLAAVARRGFTPVKLDESGTLPFADGYFDVVFCSSVIEHVTVSKSEVWSLTDGEEFARRASIQQRKFADELRRVGKTYFVQTPARSFWLESHSWLPFASYLPRSILVPLLRLARKVWIKRTDPDWHLLTRGHMQAFFPGAQLRAERSLGFVKSWIAIG